MRNKNKSFKKKMKQILKDIDRGNSLDLSDEYTKHCLEECYNRGYVSGVHCSGRSAGNKILICVNNPKVEKLGYEFLTPQINWVQLITLICSIIAAITSVIGLLIK